ncbi:MAG: DUF5602 domain-containing protein [Acidobacteria bacterium]|nr:DUF5602 domain-containing protein [Acidobacteriota bacterium]
MQIHNRNTNFRPRILAAWIVLGLVPAFAASEPQGVWDQSKQTGRTFYGPPKSIGAGSARVYVVVKDGRPVEIGAELTKDALEGLPTPDTVPAGHEHMAGRHVMQEYLLSLPKEAEVTPFKLIELDWNPQGHEPKGIYDQPHFDFHFYTVPQNVRDAIDPADPQFTQKAELLPDQQLVPVGYIVPRPVTAVPHMGVHWVNRTAGELNGKLFTQTFIRGSWNGHMIFYEPMVTKAFLDSKPNSSFPIALANCYDPAGYHPTTYNIRYDPSRRQYRISLSDFALRSCNVRGTSIASAQ